MILIVLHVISWIYKCLYFHFKDLVLKINVFFNKQQLTTPFFKVCVALQEPPGQILSELFQSISVTFLLLRTHYKIHEIFVQFIYVIPRRRAAAH